VPPEIQELADAFDVPLLPFPTGPYGCLTVAAAASW
jgi:hypothetical protein